MKNHSSTVFSISLLVTGLACGAALSGCSKGDREEAKATVKDSYAESKAATAKAWADVKDHTWEKRSDFTAGVKAVTSKLDADVSQLRADYSEAKASASRKSAMAELKDSEANYKEKMNAMGNATAATWDSAKKNVTLAWDRLEASYYKARSD